MTTDRLGLPSELKRRLQYTLPRQHGIHAPVVRVTPRDDVGRRCAAWAAEYYEVQAYYTTIEADSLDRLEQALGEMPEVHVATQVRRRQGRNELTNPEWPAALGVSRRGFNELRAQVLALVRDEP